MRETVDHHDAELMLRLYELRREEKLRRARAWFVREFKAKTLSEVAEQCPPGSDEDAYYRMLTGYWEMAASIVNHGLINQEFFYESNGEFFVVWEKLKPFVDELRQARKNSHVWENLEALAKDFERWSNKRSPGALNAFRERLGLSKG